MATDLRVYLDSIRYPGAAVTLRVNNIYGSLTNSHGMIQVISRIMYHSMLQSYAIDSSGRQQLNVLDFEILRASVGKFVGEYTCHKIATHVAKSLI